MLEDTKAPDFNGDGYPSRGELIGPAWDRIWRFMATGEWVCGSDVAATMSLPTGLKPATIKNLLRQAASVGVLEAELRVDGAAMKRHRALRTGRSRAWYRRFE